MKKLSKMTINVIKEYLLVELKSNKVTLENFEEMMEILSSKISGLVTNMEEGHNDSQYNRDLLEKLDNAFDEMNEADDIDFDELNQFLG